jgi:succinate-semialdehyde dehydrogenase / glutarate-semialdehyde dehydrogenase
MAHGTTVLTNVRKGIPAYEDESFGPWRLSFRSRTEAQAIAIANDSVLLIGGGVITRDLARGERIAAEMIEGGCVLVNDAMRSDPRLPFGGFKEGEGRRLRPRALELER